LSTVAGLIVERLLESGVRTLFGMPGGGSNMDILEAATEAGLPFVLSHTETAGALMAAAQAEIQDSPGACLATLGPGVASIANGVAHALLDRVPLVVLTDSHPSGGRGTYLHQSLDHHALLRPVTKWRATLTPESGDEVLTQALSNALSPPPGPVQIDCSPDSSRAPAPSFVKRAAERVEGRPANLTLPPGVERLLKQARRPLLLIGLGARKPADVSAIRSWCERAGIPALTTYKAKGVIPDQHPLFAGVLTNGALEASVLQAADLFLLVGLDPVELLPRPWKYRQAAVYCGRWALEQRHLPIDAQLVGEIGESLATLQEILPLSNDWSLEWIASEAKRQRSAVRIATAGLSPSGAVEAVAAALPENARLTLDAGAHMFPAMALLPAREAHQILISNGLSTMAFALPAAIGAALVDRDRWLPSPATAVC
jgi:acetolactate synthase-1/2/3 large subunit